jgi:acyl-CoA dehydrogenase
MSIIHTDSAVQLPSKNMSIDNDNLKAYIKKEKPELFMDDNDELESYQFVHGQSNPTYLITIGRLKYVLRKQPPG